MTYELSFCDKIEEYLHRNVSLNNQTLLNHAQIFRQVYPSNYIKTSKNIIFIFPYGKKVFVNLNWDKNKYIEGLNENGVKPSQLENIIKVMERC
jgi:hypothetical protein